MQKNSAIRSGIGYTMANILIRGISFLTVPIFSRVLAPNDFGVYNVFVAYDSILFCVVGLALHSSVKSANWEFPGKIDEYVSSVSLIYVAVALLLTAVCGLAGPALKALVGLPALVIELLVAHSFGTAVIALYNARVSLEYSYKKYMAVAATSSVLNVALSLLLIFSVFNDERYLGRIAGATITTVGLGIVLLALFWKRARPHYNAVYWRFGVHYSLPIVPHGISQVLLAQFDRLMINSIVSAAAAGVYSLASYVMIIMNVLSDSIATVWSTWFYEVMSGEPAGDAQTRAEAETRTNSAMVDSVQLRASQLIHVMAIVAAGIMTLAPEIIWVLGGEGYLGGVLCTYGMVLSGYCVFLYNLIVVGEYYRQSTRSVMVGTLMAAAINVALNTTLIGRLGFVAAAYTTFASYACYVAFHWVICRRLLGFSIIPIGMLISTAAPLVAVAVVGIVWQDATAARLTVCALALVWLCIRLIKFPGNFEGVKGMFGARKKPAR